MAKPSDLTVVYRNKEFNWPVANVPVHAKTRHCTFCGTPGLHWQNLTSSPSNAVWRLFDAQGTMHDCRRIQVQAKNPNRSEPIPHNEGDLV